MLGHKQQRVQKLQMTHFHVTTLSRQARFDTLQLLLAYLHSLTITPNISLVLTRPSHLNPHCCVVQKRVGTRDTVREGYSRLNRQFLAFKRARRASTALWRGKIVRVLSG